METVLWITNYDNSFDNDNENINNANDDEDDIDGGVVALVVVADNIILLVNQHFQSSERTSLLSPVYTSNFYVTIFICSRR